MKKAYDEVKMVVVFMAEEVIRTSQNDNVEDMPEFPEFFE